MQPWMWKRDPHVDPMWKRDPWIPCGQVRTDPGTFFGFWGSCYNSYFSATPHEGYTILSRWRDTIVGKQLIARRPRTASAGSLARSSAGSLARSSLSRPNPSLLPTATTGQPVARANKSPQTRSPQGRDREDLACGGGAAGSCSGGRDARGARGEARDPEARDPEDATNDEDQEQAI